MTIYLKLKYKGNRTYLQGGDIFNALEDAFSVSQSGYLSKLVFKRFARNQIAVVMEQPAEGASVLGTAIWKSALGDERRLWLIETGVAVTESYPFDEQAIVAQASVHDQHIQLTAPNTYSLIENIVALTKRLNYVLSPDVSGKWLFGQLDLKRGLPGGWESLCIDRTICVANNFSRNRILIDGQHYGEIRFIGGEP